MSDNDLLAQVSSLREEVAQLDALLKTVARGLGTESDVLSTGMAALVERVETLEVTGVPAPETSDPEPQRLDSAEVERLRPRAWVNYAGPKDWEKLAAWVEWLHVTYDVRPSTRVPACWPAHLGVVEELAALHAAWRQAADEARPVVEGSNGVKQRGPQADTSALVYWHDRWLHPFLTRLFALYRISDCKDKHTSSPGKKVATDQDLLRTAIGTYAQADPPPPRQSDHDVPGDDEPPQDHEPPEEFEPPEYLEPADDREPAFDPVTAELLD